MSGDWHDSLFKDEKGDSLGDGTWGKPDPNEGKLAPIEWDKLPEAPDPSKRVRARLATPAPGSQKESGLLDIKSLAPSLAAGMRKEDPELLRGNRQPTPPPVGARLATSAKGSAGSGLIDVQELVRVQEQREQSKEREKGVDLVAEAAIEAMNNSASRSGSSLSTNLSSSGVQQKQAMPELLDDLDEQPNRSRSTLVMVVVVLTLAFAGLAIYVLSQG